MGIEIEVYKTFVNTGEGFYGIDMASYAVIRDGEIREYKWNPPPPFSTYIEVDHYVIGNKIFKSERELLAFVKTGY